MTEHLPRWALNIYWKAPSIKYNRLRVLALSELNPKKKQTLKEYEKDADCHRAQLVADFLGWGIND